MLQEAAASVEKNSSGQNQDTLVRDFSFGAAHSLLSFRGFSSVNLLAYGF